MKLPNDIKGLMIVTAGMDCSGKGTIIAALVEWAKERELSIFDLREYEKKLSKFPRWEEISKSDVIVSAEPHYALVGAGLREEVLQSNERDYGAIETAQLFALDREIAYKRLIIPSLKEGKIIFQERHVESSLVYQPLQALLQGSICDENSFREQYILNLTGNILALTQYPATVIFIARCSVDEAMRRVRQRKDKSDNCKFEQYKFQSMLKERYESKWFENLFKGYGTDVISVDTSGPDINVSRQNARQTWENYCKKKKRDGNLCEKLERRIYCGIGT